MLEVLTGKKRLHLATFSGSETRREWFWLLFAHLEAAVGILVGGVRRHVVGREPLKVPPIEPRPALQQVGCSLLITWQILVQYIAHAIHGTNTLMHSYICSH